MDIFVPIVLCVIFFILFSICGWCCKRKREGTVYGFHTTNNEATQHVSATPVVVPPYPVAPRHPVPHSGAPAPGFAQHNPPYPIATPYPPAAAPMYYYPPPMGSTPYVPPPGTFPAAAPYPPAAPYPMGHDYSAQPPSYSEAVGHPSVNPPLPTKEGYAKQSPYNPNY